MTKSYFENELSSENELLIQRVGSLKSTLLNLDEKSLINVTLQHASNRIRQSRR